MNIVFIYADDKEKGEWNCSEWRCAIPHRAINRQGKHKSTMVWREDWTKKTEESINVINDADIVIIQRHIYPINLAQIVTMRSMGKAVVIDLDDAYHYIPPSLLGYHYWIQGKVAIQDDNNKWVDVVAPHAPISVLEWAVKLATCVTSPSELICSDWTSRFGVKTFFFPNLLESSIYYPRERISKDTMVIGWGGSLSHTHSFLDTDILPAIRKIGKERKNVLFSFIGGMGTVLSRRLPEVNLLDIQRVSPDKYPEELSKIDISIMPLAGLYDRRRSWLKAMECLAMGIPWIASKGEPYAQFKKYGRLIDNTQRTWYLEICNALDNFDTLKSRALENTKDIERFDVDKNVDSIINLFERIIDYEQYPFQSDNQWRASHWSSIHDLGE